MPWIYSSKDHPIYENTEYRRLSLKQNWNLRIEWVNKVASIILEGIHLDFVKIIFGSGMGIPQELIYESIGKRFLLHNDWIKLFIEGGLISISIAILHLNKLTIIPKIFICIWMMTDNVIVYFPVILLLDWYEYQRKNIIIWLPASTCYFPGGYWTF